MSTNPREQCARISPRRDSLYDLVLLVKRFKNPTARQRYEKYVNLTLLVFFFADCHVFFNLTSYDKRPHIVRQETLYRTM